MLKLGDAAAAPPALGYKMELMTRTASAEPRPQERRESQDTSKEERHTQSYPERQGKTFPQKNKTKTMNLHLF